jgi:hypothetical protein
MLGKADGNAMPAWRCGDTIEREALDDAWSASGRKLQVQV